jgi:hypothetical protein
LIVRATSMSLTLATTIAFRSSVHANVVAVTCTAESV